MWVTVASLFTIAAICAAFFIAEYVTAKEEIAEYTQIKSAYTTVQHPTQSKDDENDRNKTAYLPFVQADFDALLAVNADTVGWLAIPDTQINYPVVQTQDNNKYLNTSFLGKKSKTGAVFMDCYNSVDPLSKHTILYGHNMGKGRKDMFGTLLYYKELSYYQAHPYIQFNTIHGGEGWWKIFAVIELDVKSQKLDYLRLSFEDNAHFEQWITQTKTLSIYDTGVEVQPNKKILTLSTCDRSKYGRNGRMLILAVKN